MQAHTPKIAPNYGMVSVVYGGAEGVRRKPALLYIFQLLTWDATLVIVAANRSKEGGFLLARATYPFSA